MANSMSNNDFPSISAHQLIDFDWKLKYAVSSSSLGAINKPLLRLELCVSETPDAVKEPVMIPTHQTADDKPLFLLSENSKSELDNLISEMEAIEKALDESPAN
jgi:hypothetical protein